MTRRGFLSLIGGVTAAPSLLWPFAARAQQAAMPVVGFLHSASLDSFVPMVAAFHRGLDETGFVEGRNVAIEHRWAENRLDQLPALADDLVHRRVAVIVTNNAATPAARAATSAIPIVFASGADPVTSGLVTNLNRPGGNVTGVSFLTSPLSVKRLQLLHDLVPQGRMIAVMLDPNTRPFATEFRELMQSANAMGRQISVVNASNEPEVEKAFATFVEQRAGALLVGAGVFYTDQRETLVALAARHALPTIYPFRDYPAAGGLMSYGTSITEAYRRAGVYAGQILKGAKPSELPVLLPTRFELVINLKTAQALGLTIPPGVLAIVDEVIE